MPPADHATGYVQTVGDQGLPADPKTSSAHPRSSGCWAASRWRRCATAVPLRGGRQHAPRWASPAPAPTCFLEGAFYNDLRAPGAADLSAPVREFCAAKGLRPPPRGAAAAEAVLESPGAL